MSKALIKLIKDQPKLAEEYREFIIETMLELQEVQAINEARGFARRF